MWGAEAEGTIQKLAAAAVTGKVYGIDYAKGSVAASRAKNAVPTAPLQPLNGPVVNESQ
jgi:hypothetical protein